MSQSLFLPAVLFSCVIFALALGPGAGCTTTPPPTLPSATTELLTERNRIAVTLRMGEALDRLAQQAWEEKRRVRTMEEARASSGGITLGGYPGNGGGVGGVSTLDELSAPRSCWTRASSATSSSTRSSRRS